MINRILKRRGLVAKEDGDVQALERFERYGLRWLSVWLMEQGIRLHYGQVRRPQTQGKVERFHRTLPGR